MFDVGWSELLIVGVVALLVVGPKELPGLLRTIGRFIGMIKRQAGEFRSQFDEAMNEAEMQELKKQVTDIRSDAEATLRDAASSFEKEASDTPSIHGDEQTGKSATAADEPIDAGIDAELPPEPKPAGNAGAAAIAAAAAAAHPAATPDKTGA